MENPLPSNYFYKATVNSAHYLADIFLKFLAIWRISAIQQEFYMQCLSKFDYNWYNSIACKSEWFQSNEKHSFFLNVKNFLNGYSLIFLSVFYYVVYDCNYLINNVKSLLSNLPFADILHREES